MAFNPNIIPTTIKALTTFVQVLDRHRFGAVMLFSLTVAASALVVAAHLPAVISRADRQANTISATAVPAQVPGSAAAGAHR